MTNSNRSGPTPKGPNLLKDIKVPPEYKNFTKVLKERKGRDFFKFLIGPICPYSQSIKDALVPQTVVQSECQQSFDKFFNLFKTQPVMFTPVPTYTILYLCGLLSVVNDKSMVKSSIDFITKFITLLNDSVTDAVLDILLPTILFNVTSDDPPVRAPFLLNLSEQFGVNTLLSHLLSFFDTVVSYSSMITRFHITCLTKIVEAYSIDEKNFNKAKEFATSLLDGQNMEHARTLLQTLDECDIDKDTPMTSPRNSSLLSPRKSPRSVASRRSFNPGATASIATPSMRSISPDILIELLDIIETRSFDSAIEILNDVRAQLERLKEFPSDHDFEPLFKLAIDTYKSRRTTPDQKKMIYLLMTCANNVCDPASMLNLYLQASENENLPKDFLEQCYQHFLKTSHAKERLPENTNIPVSLSLASNDHNPRKDVEFAFTCLNQWESSYDGVRRIWELLNREPDTDLSEYFDPLIFTQKSFLVEGLRKYMEIENSSELMKGVVDALDLRMMSETKSDRVAREALEVNAKMNAVILNESVKMPSISPSEKMMQTNVLINKGLSLRKNKPGDAFDDDSNKGNNGESKEDITEMPALEKEIFKLNPAKKSPRVPLPPKKGAPTAGSRLRR